MKNKILALGLVLLMTGCASVSMTDMAASHAAKEFKTPSEGKAGLYVYRSNTAFGAGLKKDIWVDGHCLGESARGVFFFTEVDGNQTHTIATESEFSPNLLTIHTEAGKNYFVRQYIKMGVFVAGAQLEQVHEQAGKQAVYQLNMAQAGNCSQPFKQ